MVQGQRQRDNKMSQICTICRHEKCHEINQALLAGEPFRNVAKRYRTSTMALFRHKRADLPGTLVKAKHAAEEIQAESLFDRLREINRETAQFSRRRGPPEITRSRSSLSRGPKSRSILKPDY
jgi:hypothetical protein